MKKILRSAGILFIAMSPCSLIAQCICPSPLYNQTYDSISSFTYIQNTLGSMISANGQLWYNNPIGGNYNKMYDSIPGLSAISSAFTASCKFFPVNGNSPGHMLMMFSESSDDAFTLQSPFPKTFNDALGAIFLSPNLPTGSTCCTNPTDPSNPWGFRVFAKKDTALDYSIYFQSINLPSLNSWYYLVLQRVNASQVTLSVFSDSLFTQNIPGSPLCFFIDPTIGPFNYLQQGVLTPASQYRVINAYLDDLKICSGTSCTVICPLSVAENGDKNNFFEIKSNPAVGSIILTLNDFLSVNKFSIVMADAAGKKVFEKYYAGGMDNIEINPVGFSDGLYFITVRTDDEVAVKKIVFRKE